MILHFINIFFIIWEMLCCRFLVDTFCDKRKLKPRAVREMLFAGLCLIEIAVCYGIRGSLPLRLTVSIVVTWAFMCAIFESNFIKILTFVILFFGIDASWDNFFYLIVGPFPEYPEAFYYVIMALSRIITLMTVLFIRYKLGRDTRIKLLFKEWLGLLSIPLITMFSSAIIAIKFVSIENSRFLVFIALGMAATNIILFLLIDSIFTREKIISDSRVLYERTKNELNMYKSISENLDNQRKWIHEIKNHLSCIKELASGTDNEALNNYVTKLDGELTETADMVDTHNVIANAIINTKYREAMEKGIVFVLKVSDLSELKLSDMDMVTILSNLLNNAFEACEGLSTGVIKFKFAVEDGRTIISVKNTYRVVPVQNGDSFVSTKTDNAAEHGFGIKNVCDVIEKYNGKYVIDFDDKDFSFSIMI